MSSRCCGACSVTDRWTYRLDGDGDGIEFLTETGHLVDGDQITRTVVLAFTASA